MTQHNNQPYDSSLKALFQEQLTGIMPNLIELTSFTVIEEVNTEILKPQPPLRADKVFKTECDDELHILPLELEVKGHKEMPKRMLSYHSLLLEEYNLPVISVVIYPFKTQVPTTPFEEKSRNKTLLTFHYYPIALWFPRRRTSPRFHRYRHGFSCPITWAAFTQKRDPGRCSGKRDQG
jgi:hypothetical protein